MTGLSLTLLRLEVTIVFTCDLSTRSILSTEFIGSLHHLRSELNDMIRLPNL